MIRWDAGRQESHVTMTAATVLQRLRRPPAACVLFVVAASATVGRSISSRSASRAFCLTLASHPPHHPSRKCNASQFDPLFLSDLCTHFETCCCLECENVQLFCSKRLTRVRGRNVPTAAATHCPPHITFVSCLPSIMCSSAPLLRS